MRVIGPQTLVVIRSLAVVGVASLVAASTVSAEEPYTVQPSGFQTWNDVKGSDLATHYSVIGILDGLLHAEQLDARRLDWVEACVEGTTAGQVVAIVEKYLQERPEWWHVPLAPLVQGALAEACPR